MRFDARVTPQYIRDGTGDLCQRLGIRLIPSDTGTIVIGPIPSLISMFTALATHYRLTLTEIKEKFA